MPAPLYLQEEHQVFRYSLRKFLEKEAAPHYEKWEKDRLIPRSFWEKMGQQGFLCLVFLKNSEVQKLILAIR